MLSSSRLFDASTTQLDHKRLTTLINNLSEGFLAVNADGTIEMSNGVALSLLDVNSLTAKPISSVMILIDAHGAATDPLQLVNNVPNFSSGEYSLKYADGTNINIYINISKVRAGYGDSDGEGFVILFRDITREKTLEQEREEFISVASHELRNPVAIVEGSISNALMLVDKATDTATIGQLLKSAHEQVLFLGNLINDLAMISRADRAKLTESAAEFDAVEMMKSLQADYTGQAQKKGLVIEVEAAQVPKIYGSQLYTREVLQNFITNAIKYTDQGSIKLKITNLSNGIELSVADNGIGISPDEQRKLFTKFFRSEDARVQKINGTGLGLYVAAKLAKLMGGSIAMSSEINKGSVFALRLPYSIRNDSAKGLHNGS